MASYGCPVASTSAWDVLGNKFTMNHIATSQRTSRKLNAGGKRKRSHHRLRGPIASARTCSIARTGASIRSRRQAQLQLSQTRDLTSTHNSAIQSLDLDKQEDRYLLTGGSNGNVSIFDLEGETQVASSTDLNSNANMARPLGATGFHRRATVARFSRMQGMAGHRSSVNSIAWYPVDNGLFATGGADNAVIVWSTGAMLPAASFDMEHIVNSVSMSPTRQHCLLATGTQHCNVRLCDPSSGSFSHVLVGHTQPVLATAWSPINPHLLVSGGTDRTIRFWDIRRSGSAACMGSLDMHEQSDRAKQVGGYAYREPDWMTLDTGNTNQDKAIKSRRRNQDGDESHDITALRNKVRGPQATAATSLVTAHSSAVTALQFAHEGKYLVSSGSRDSMRVWIAHPTRDHEYRNTFTVFDQEPNDLPNPMPLAVAMSEPSLPFATTVFRASSVSQVVTGYNMFSGKVTNTLKGHYQRVTAIVCRNSVQELYTGAEDGMVLAWEPKGGEVKRCEVYNETRGGYRSMGATSVALDTAQAHHVIDSDEDEWSD